MRHYASVMATASPDALGAALSEDEVARDAALMKQEESAWQVADQLETDEIVALVRFFTLAEQQLPGWDGGKQSPVIPLVRILRARDAFPGELRKWIKANTDNRWLPYGSAL